MHFKVIAVQHGPMFESLFILFSLLFRKSSEIDRIKQNHAGLVDCVSSRKRCAETSWRCSSDLKIAVSNSNNKEQKKAETSLQRPPVTNKSRRICCRMRQRRQWPARRPITKRQTAWLSPAPTTKNLAAILSRSSNQSAVTTEHYWPLYVLRTTFFILLTRARIVRNRKQSRTTWIPVYCFVGFDHAGRLNDERNATLIMSV